MTTLRAYQEELRKLLFFQTREPERSPLWEAGLPERLEVYRHNVRSNWTGTLDHDFPLTRQQFAAEAWTVLRKDYFIRYPPPHWELNASLAAFPGFLAAQKASLFVKELADFEWHDLKIFIDRAEVRPHSGITNPTAVVRVYQHQVFHWVEAGVPPQRPPERKPEVLVFYRDGKNTSHIREADPLMLMMLDHFRKPGARLEDLEPVREELLPANRVPLADVADQLTRNDLLLL